MLAPALIMIGLLTVWAIGFIIFLQIKEVDDDK
jgi:preprotein translocase subunit Sss1